MTESLLEDAHNLKASVLVLSAKSSQGIPLAKVEYNPNELISFHCEFPCADHNQILVDQVEERPATGSRNHYQYNYFQWEYLVGAKLGFAEFEDDQSGELVCKMDVTKVGQYYRKHLNSELISKGRHRFADMKSSSYQGRISHQRSRWVDVPGALQLDRRNKDTGEVWSLTVPDALTPERYRQNFNISSFEDFLIKYPVTFSVKKLGERVQSFSTWKILRYCSD